MFAFLALVALLAVPVAAWQVHRHEVAAAPAPVAEAAPLPARPGMHPGMRPGAHAPGQVGGQVAGQPGADAQARLGPPPGARLTPEQLRERHAGKLPPAKFKGQVPGPRGMASADGVTGGVTEGAAGGRPRPQGGMRARSAAPGTATAPETSATSGTASGTYPETSSGTATGAYPEGASGEVVAPGTYPDSSTVAPTEEVAF